MQLHKTRKTIAKYVALPLFLGIAAALIAAPAKWALVVTLNNGAKSAIASFDDHGECLAEAAFFRKDPLVQSAHCSPVR